MNISSRGSAFVLTVAASLCAMACGQSSDSASGAGSAATASADPSASTGWTSVRDAMIEDYFKAHPVFTVVSGRHEYDGVLPDWSAAGIGREIQRLHGARDRALVVPDATLDEKQRFEREFLVA